MSIVDPTIATVIGGLILASILGAFAWYKSRRKKDLPGKKDETLFTVMVADVKGDTDKVLVNSLIESLKKEPGIHVMKAPGELSPSDRTDLDLAREDAEKKARKWMEDGKADVLVWGELSHDTKIKLHFLPNKGDRVKDPNRPISLKKWTLPDIASETFYKQLIILTTTAVVPTLVPENAWSMRFLPPVIIKLQNLLEADKGEAFTKEQTANLHRLLGQAAASMANSTGDVDQWRPIAEQAFEAAIEGFTALGKGEEMALTQLLLAETSFARPDDLNYLLKHQSLAKHLLDTPALPSNPDIQSRARLLPLIWQCFLNGNVGDGSLLEKTTTQLMREIETLSPNTTPKAWVLAHRVLGYSAYYLACRGYKAWIGHSIDARRVVLNSFSEGLEPFAHAWAQIGLTSALYRSEDPKHTEEGAVLARAASATYDRKNEQIRYLEAVNWWADCLQRLGGLTSRAEPIIEAINLLMLAKRELGAHTQPPIWQHTTACLARAHIGLWQVTCVTGQSAPDAAHLIKAAAYLQELPVEDSLFSLNCLCFQGMALVELGEQNRSIQLLEQGIICLRDALVRAEIFGGVSNAAYFQFYLAKGEVKLAEYQQRDDVVKVDET